MGQAALFGFALYYARIVPVGTEQSGANIITFVTILLFAGVPACLPLTERPGAVRTGIACLLAQALASILMAAAGASMPASSCRSHFWPWHRARCHPSITRCWPKPWMPATHAHRQAPRGWRIQSAHRSQSWPWA
ncbi:hypothetical protein GGR01_002495 [Acetobacter oeni]|nr:hypothetical protein [Acetobacter oeni]